MQIAPRFLAALLALLSLVALAILARRVSPAEAADSPQAPVRRVEQANQRGTELLRQGNALAAAQVFEAVSDDLAAIPATGCGLHFNYFHNSGEALEDLGQLEPALLRYWHASNSCPGSLRALEDTLRLSREISSSSTAQEVKAALAERVLAEGDLGLAAQILRETLMEPDRIQQRASLRLLTALTRYCATAPVGSDQFREEWRPLVEQARFRLKPPAQAWSDRLLAVYYGELPPALGVATSGPPREWQELPDQGKVLPQLLKARGDESFREGEEGTALELYTLAWALDRNDPTKALYLMNLLASSRLPVDPQGQIRKALADHFTSWSCNLCTAESRKSHAVLLRLLEETADSGPAH